MAPLESWNDGAAKASILDFVGRVSAEGGEDYVPPPARVAVFDNDGTLWCEQPVYTQVAFAFDRVKALAPKYPDWKGTPPFQAVLDPTATPVVERQSASTALVDARNGMGHVAGDYAMRLAIEKARAHDA